MVFKRSLIDSVLEDLAEYPAVGILGPRQVGKTTFVKTLSEHHTVKKIEYLDLQLPSTQVRLTDPEGYLSERSDRLVVLDEIQLQPKLFGILRSLIDIDRQPARFIILGSASPDLMRGASETLAGRISYNEMMPFGLPELDTLDLNWRDHWITGGFPVPLFQMSKPSRRLRWFDNLLATFVSRDLAELGQRADATEIARLLNMIATLNGQLINKQSLSRSLTVSAQTVDRYVNLLERAFLIRRLRPWLPNLSKRLVKAPKVFIRDSGMLHGLLRVASYDQLRGHGAVGASWEGYVIEEVARVLGNPPDLHFYRTAAGAELDLVFELRGERIAVEIKLSNAPSLTKGFYHAIEDVQPTRTYVVVPEVESFMLKVGIRVIGLKEFLNVLAAMRLEL